MHLISIFWILIVTCSAADLSPPISHVSFEYLQLYEPWQTAPCLHSKSNPYDWEVQCNDVIRTRKFSVHLALSFYPHSSSNNSSYELLYWVTDLTDPANPNHNSTTIWVHNDGTENKARLIEVSLGIENDLAALKLSLNM